LLDRRTRWAWCLYDAGLSSYNTIVGTFIFSVYFAKGVVGDEAWGSALWGWATGGAGLAVALLSPVLGAIADRQGRIVPWLRLATLATIALTVVLWFVEPSRSSIVPALAAIVAGSITFEIATLFYSALLPRVAPPGMLGRMSGWGWACGYAGGIVCLGLALVGFVQPEQPWFGFTKAGAANIRATALLAAAWLAVFTLPLLFVLRDPPGAGISLPAATRAGFAQLGRTLASARGNGNLWRFLLASALYRDGLVTVFAVGGLYAAGTFGLTISQVIQLGIGLNVAAGIGALGFAWADDKVGSKTAVRLSLAGLLLAGIPLLLVESGTWFVVMALALSLFVGPAQSASRSLLVRLVPQDRIAEMFGLYGLTGRAFSFLGPTLFATVTAATGSQRWGMATTVLFFAAGWALLETVRDPQRTV
jgi:UMF1 family MFS transporter